ncbi:MAG TPA: PRTRC system protein B [Bryobacteraceae bacterium]|jgi:PRTRC genetic system protein B
MRVYVEYGAAAPFELVKAILLYGTKDRIRLATVHSPEPDPNGGPPILGEGRPVTREFVERLSRDLHSELPASWLPEHILVWSHSLVAWWEPARVRPMFFEQTTDGKMLDGKLFPHPPLVFAVQHMRLSVWALAENERPSPETTLCAAPYWNTAEDGTVCHGSMPVPRAITASTLGQWSEAYFMSRFTHSNFGRNPCRHVEGFLGMWRDLAGKKTFPADYLVPGKTLCATLRLTA